MIGNIIGGVIIAFLASFAIGTIISIITQIVARRRGAGENKKTKKEDDQSNSNAP